MEMGIHHHHHHHQLVSIIDRSNKRPEYELEITDSHTTTKANAV